ncbi:hypothetical protein ZWY2020_038392 [Hordeum vulgare]|nr:hypothetical protein ZWY2020_038392 [Hordeum vulgare]
MDPAAAAARRQADKWMSVAEKLLMARDLEGCKEFSSQAIAADPRTPGAEDLYAAADVLLASQRRRLPSGQPDPYAVLGLDPANPASRHPDVVHPKFRRLSLLLNRSHPDRPCSVYIAEAARLVADAWAFLSNAALKSALDAELDAAAAPRAPMQQPAVERRPQPSPPPQQSPYDRLYEARKLKCSSCHQPFVAEAMAEPPPIVPGTDMYYCTWGFFPIGFPGCPGFADLVNSQPQGSGQLSVPWLGANGGMEANGKVAAENGTPITIGAAGKETVSSEPSPEPLMHMEVEVPLVQYSFAADSI